MIFNAVGAVVCALIIAFSTGWKLTFIVLLFVPLMVLSGILQGRRMTNAKQTKEKKTGPLSWAEKGGMVSPTALRWVLRVIVYLLVCNGSDWECSNSSWSPSWRVFHFKLWTMFQSRIPVRRSIEFGRADDSDESIWLPRRSMIKIQIQALGTALANSLMFFIHAAAFGYGSVLVRNGEMQGIRVFR